MILYGLPAFIFGVKNVLHGLPSGAIHATPIPLD